jgi:hypothetical protein
MIYLFLLAHLVADFLLQPYWLVLRKRYWHGLLIHGGIVLLCMLLLGLIDRAVLSLWPAMLGITAIHIAADWWKVHRADRLFRPAIVPFLLDQLIHVATIGGILSLTLPPEKLWTLSGSPVASTAVYIAVYIIAACAAPIGVMVWLDPAFAHAALAGKARLRSLMMSATVLSLTLLGGIVALPATLLGLVVITRRQISPHPLDTPRGMLAVLCIAATLGMLLAMALR